jgi:hypothetical protein
LLAFGVLVVQQQLPAAVGARQHRGRQRHQARQVQGHGLVGPGRHMQAVPAHLVAARIADHGGAGPAAHIGHDDGRPGRGVGRGQQLRRQFEVVAAHHGVMAQRRPPGVQLGARPGAGGEFRRGGVVAGDTGGGLGQALGQRGEAEPHHQPEQQGAQRED